MLMWFFIYFLIFAQCCFAADLPDDEILSRVRSYDCANTLSACVKEVVEGCPRKKIGVLDFDELLVKGKRTFLTGKIVEHTVATELGKRLDALLGNHEFCGNLHGLLILTARLARPVDGRNINRRFSEGKVSEHRRFVMETTNRELKGCLPNIAKFLRSKANFGGELPDRLRYEEEEQYKVDGYTEHPNGFIWNCGVVVMGGAMDEGGEIRHCKHSTLVEVLQSFPTPKEYTVFYLDDSAQWFGPFLERGFCEGVSMRLFHYNFEEAEKWKRIVLPSSYSYTPVEEESVSSVSYLYSTVKYCCALVTVVCIAKRYCLSRGLNPFNYIRDAVKLMRYIAYKILFG